MDALVLAAGLGRRLYPLTETRPKCLVRVAGRPLVEHVLERLELYDVGDIGITAFHFADQVQRYFASRGGRPVRVVREPALLGTGGGVRNALASAGPVRRLIVHNCDIVSEVDLRGLLDAHDRSGADATLVTRARTFGRSLAFDFGGELLGRARDVSPRAAAKAELAEFCGIHVLGARTAALIMDSTASCLIDLFIEAARAGLRVRRYDIEETFWMDVGTVDLLQSFAGRPMATTGPRLQMQPAL